MKEIKKILACAGSDSIGGAGIQADIKTVSAHGHYAMTAITAVTAQNTMGVSLAEPVSPEMMRGQLEAVFEDIFPDAVKIGMMMNSENVKIIADVLKTYNAVNIVCDTVIMSTSGRQLLDDDGVRLFRERLMPIADIITPNIPEAERLCGMKISCAEDMERAAALLYGESGGAVLVKGGHLDGEAHDILVYDGKTQHFTAKRIASSNNHGTGCTLSSAIACGLAEGKSINEAVASAKRYISAVIGAGLDIGKGNGPMWHFV